MNTDLNTLPKQPPLWVSYMYCGRLLHASTLIFILESYLYYIPLERAIDNNSTIWIGYWSFMFLFAFFHIFLVMADAWSRFQNYKRAKDQLFEYGFQPRIVNHYIGSKCQRLAVETAARELGFEDEVKKQFRLMGYRWYHYIPDFMIKDPYFLFKKYFWKRTFLEKHYTPKYNFQELSAQLYAE